MKQLIGIILLLALVGCKKERATVEGSQGPSGDNGKDGVSCTVTKSDAGKFLSCSDGTFGELLKGDQGSQGDKGLQGDRGFNGAKGDKGDRGSSSFNGKDGAPGRDGKNGTESGNGSEGCNASDHGNDDE